MIDRATLRDHLLLTIVNVNPSVNSDQPLAYPRD